MFLIFLLHSTGKSLYKLTSLPCFLLWKLQINSCVSLCAGLYGMWPARRRRFLWAPGGGCLGVIELLLGEVDGYGVNCICKLESHLWLLFLFCFVSSVLLLDFVICQCIYRITGFCNISSSFFFFPPDKLVGQHWFYLQSPEWQVLQLIVFYFVFGLFCNHNISLNLGLYLHLLYLVHWVI